MANHCSANKRSAVFTVFLVVLLAATAGCQGGPPQITIESASAELSPALYGEGLVFLTIKNAGGRDTLLGAKVSIPGATASIHQMRGGLMVISKRMSIPAQATVAFYPAESHIMIENMPRELKEGASFTLTLIFERSGEKQVPLTMKKAPASMLHEHHQ
jgi:copper(I)-binding protein